MILVARVIDLLMLISLSLDLEWVKICDLGMYECSVIDRVNILIVELGWDL